MSQNKFYKTSGKAPTVNLYQKTFFKSLLPSEQRFVKPIIKDMFKDSAPYLVQDPKKLVNKDKEVDP
jgi:hypothetical protein